MHSSTGGSLYRDPLVPLPTRVQPTGESTMNVDGFYKVGVKAPLGTGTGVLVMRADRFEGGDGEFYWRGSYLLVGDELRVEANIGRHTAGSPGILGVDSASFKLAGKVGHLGHTKLTSTPPGIEATLTPIA